MTLDRKLRNIQKSVIAARRERPSEARLLTDRHKLEAIFLESPAAMALWHGPDMVFEMVNPMYQAIFPGRKLLGRPFLEALPEFKGQPFSDLFRKVLETGEPYIGHEILAQHRRTEDGPIEDHYYDFTYVRIEDFEGRPYGVYDHAVDVTERVLARRALEKSIAELKQERERRERFVATLSHDLRTPLTAAKMSAQLLGKKAAEEPSLQKLASRIILNMERADDMIRDLLDANRISVGESLPMEISFCDLNLLASETLEELSTVHGDRFVLRADQKIRGFWSCSGVRRILENLCHNAIKYGEPDRPVTVSLEATETSATISVHNAGNPIPVEEQTHLFHPFRRTSSAATGGQKGWGLGLTLVKGLTEAHGGAVTVESSAEHGTTFKVTLPVDLRSPL